MSEKVRNFSSVPVDAFSQRQITSVWSLLQSVQWAEPWLVSLLLFHASCLAFTLFSCRFYRLQILHFLTMIALVYSAEYLNKLGAMNWRSFSHFQYFDSNGMFISLVFSIPLLMNTLIIVAVWVSRTFRSMTELKMLQAKRKAARERAKKSQ